MAASIGLVEVRKATDRESIQSSTTPDPGYHMGSHDSADKLYDGG